MSWVRAGVDRPLALHAQELEAVAQGGEGVAQLVREHRDELVLSPVGGTQGFLARFRVAASASLLSRAICKRASIAGEQLPRAERLDHVVVGSRIQRLDAGLFARARRQQHHGHLAHGGLRPHRARQLRPVELRHHDVGQDEIGPRSPRRRERLLPVGDGLDVIAPGRAADARIRACRGCRPPRRCAGAAPRRASASAAAPRKPPQRLLDEGVGPESGRREQAPGSDPLGGEVRCPERHADLNVLPRPSVLSAFTSPPCIFASSCTSARPIPVPSWVRLFAPLDAVKTVEDARQLGRGDARPGVHDLEHRARVAAAQADRDAPLRE